MKTTDKHNSTTATREALDKSKIFHYMWHVIRTTRVSKSVALKLAWQKARQKSDKSEKPQGLLATYQGKKLKVNGLTGLRYHFRRNGNLYTAYRMGDTIKITTAQAYRTLQNNRLDARGKDKGHSRYRWA
tara:strand:+ start:233 stop:622 length:390 start_codon:yes stop_codon:yes gene_type:complete